MFSPFPEDIICRLQPLAFICLMPSGFIVPDSLSFLLEENCLAARMRGHRARTADESPGDIAASGRGRTVDV